MKRYYIAYGSNLNVRQMKFRCPTAKIVGTAVIGDYELLYKGSKIKKSSPKTAKHNTLPGVRK